MQAPLSSTASGKQFHSGPVSAVLPCFSAEAGLLAFPSHPAPPQHGIEPVPLHRLVKQPISEGVGLAHDAGNLLGALGLYCGLLALPGVLREEHRHYASELQMISTRSRAMIDRLLSPETTGRFAGRALPESQERVVVPDVIEQCRGLLDTIARRAVQVAYEAGAALPVALPRESLERILINLTKNAAEATPQGAGTPGTITLRVSCLRAGPQAGRRANVVGQADRIVLSVEDKGCGMSSAAVKVLLGEGVEREGAHGIGFRVVRELVGASGGRLRLRSRCGSEADATHGTTVEISWAVDVTAGQSSSAADASEERRLILVARNATLRGRVQC